MIKKTISMNTIEDRTTIGTLRFVKRIAVLLLVITIVAFYVLSIHFIIQ
jgi:hypothetical protein